VLHAMLVANKSDRLKVFKATLFRHAAVGTACEIIEICTLLKKK